MRPKTVIQRLRVVIHGAVQGVGFRPFVHRLATNLGLSGWVRNTPQGVVIEAEGEEDTLHRLLRRLEKEKPATASIQSLESSFLDPIPYRGFEILHSSGTGSKETWILPDIATCSDCLTEIFDPRDRRFRYPFTNCTHCGPRYSIVETLPYDRPNTSMKSFTMCRACRREFDNPEDRRFHAQPNACPRCGPEPALKDGSGNTLSRADDALTAAADAIKSGIILAVKGLGGFHLVAHGCSEAAVALLRTRKLRAEKPLALMYPSIEMVKRDCLVSPLEERLLCSPESPIVLLARKREHHQGSPLAHSIAPGNPYLGIMLPYTPLHHILMKELASPIVATSGNLAEEPICIEEGEAFQRLGGIADLFLVHNRPIVRHVDDSIVRVMMNRELVLRRARGYAPLPIQLDEASPTVLAVGGHLKNTVALTRRDCAFLSQHIGDLENAETYGAFRRAVSSFENLYEAKPVHIASDMHPDYLSTKYAASRETPVTQVQHHFAHVAACLAENRLKGKVLGISWDGTGYGPDGSIWGGEFLVADMSGFSRIASFRQFRSALGALYEVLGAAVFERSGLAPLASFSSSELRILKRMLTNGVNAPLTSSVGRLFDVVASLTGIRQRVHFEGQAAMELEFAVGTDCKSTAYPFKLERRSEELLVDWRPTLLDILDNMAGGISTDTVATRFHRTLAEIIVEVAKRAGQDRIVLSGGCFQNKVLTEQTVTRLRGEGFLPYWHQRIPPNDGGIALGQAAVAARKLMRSDR